MGRYMTVGQLRKFIKDIPEDTPVVVPGYDHSYDEASAYFTQGRKTPLGIDEHYEEIPLEKGESVIDILLVT